MGMVLQFFGLVFLLIVMFLVVGVLFLRYKLRKFAKSLQEFGETLQTIGPPARLDLQPLAAPSWDADGPAARRSKVLETLGFERVGSFQAPELKNLEIEAWVDTSNRVASVVQDFAGKVVLTDFWTHFDDGTRITYSDSTIGGGVDHQPGHTVLHCPSMDLAELYRKFLAERPVKPAKLINAENFVEIYEETYASEMDWRNSRGGPTIEEIRRIAALQGRELDEGTIEATHELSYRQALADLEMAIRQRYLEDSGVSASEWEKVRDRLVIVHDRLDQEAFDEVTGEFLAEDEDAPEVEESGESTPRNVFAAFNAARPEPLRLKKLGSVSNPIEADLYVAPAE